MKDKDFQNGEALNNANATGTAGYNFHYWDNSKYTDPHVTWYYPYIYPQPYTFPQQRVTVASLPKIRGPLSKQPEVFITVNKSRAKVFGTNVYMPSDTEFEIEIFNPANETLGVKFKINGKYISTSHFVLYAGQRFHLDRYLDEKKRFKYVTYTVEDSKEALEAIAHNGEIEIEFYREYENPRTEINLLDGDITWYNGDPNTTLFNNCNSELKDTVNTYFTRSAVDHNGDLNLKSLNTKINNTVTTDWMSEEKTYTTKKLETGMIGKGSTSDQTFKTVDIDFEIIAATVKKLKINPLSQKPIEPKDFVRHCTGCGKKTKKDHRFCAFCGVKVE